MDDTTVVVTGASRGIGAAVARAFASAGARVAICARDREAIEATAEAIEDDGGTAMAMRADVRDEFDVERLMEEASRFGARGVDAVVANAGVYHGRPAETPIEAESYSAFDDHMRTNVRGVFAAFREALAHLTPDARLVATTGAVARETKPGIGSYAVSKAAAEAVARGFAADVDCPVGCVDPGQVDTDLSGGPGRDPEEVAGLFVWAVRDAPAEDLDGSVLGLREWRRATRE